METNTRAGPRVVVFAAAAALLVVSGCFTSASMPETGRYRSGAGWVIDGAEALRLHRAGEATFLDAREAGPYGARHVAGAYHAPWQRFSRAKDPLRGRLLGDAALLRRRIREVGVSAGRTVVVYGDAAGGWGEDGRIVWMLRALGHTGAVLLDGGFREASLAGLPMTDRAPPPGKGDFTPSQTRRYDIDRDALRALVTGGAVRRGEVTLVDTREPREFAGATPYGERRGGHVPGAVNLHYRALMDGAGRLWPRERVLAMLRAQGVTRGKRVVTYCTGGVRSGWLVVLLSDLGFHPVQNYAGSMWEWSAADPKAYPLVTR